MKTKTIRATVRVDTGLLSGIFDPDSGVSVYKGIPYAAPPIGDLRWRPPQPPYAWKGIRRADLFSYASIQALERYRLPWTKEFMVQGGISEDCLGLNVWTAVMDDKGNRPVFVFLHGGGFSEGAGSVAIYDGKALARKGMVVVTINYRLGLFGFFVHPELRKESLYQASGNYGLLDQIAALKWIRKNIGAFGGDPDCVTVAGQSSGAMSVYLLTASPLARGLFHRAIIQSGPGAFASFGFGNKVNGIVTLDEAEKEGVAFAAEIGKKTVRELRALPAIALTKLKGKGLAMRFMPVIDGWFLPEDVRTIYRAGTQNDVPTLWGMNADEGSAFPGYGKISATAFRQQARDRFKEKEALFSALYPSYTEEQACLSQMASVREIGLTATNRLAAMRADTAKTNLYLYYFNRAIPWPEHPEFGAFHTGEVPYMFDNLNLLNRPWQAVDRKLAHIMSSYWSYFAAKGNPNGNGLPQWPAYDKADIRFMILGESFDARPLPDREKAEFFETYL